MGDEEGPQAARAEQRFSKRHRTLLRLGQQIERREPDGSVLVERINQQDLAEIAGTTVYTVSRTLADWQEEKIVETGRQRLRICDPQGLAGIAEGI